MSASSERRRQRRTHRARECARLATRSVILQRASCLVANAFGLVGTNEAVEQLLYAARPPSCCWRRTWLAVGASSTDAPPLTAAEP
jgi:hypothetical protein